MKIPSNVLGEIHRAIATHGAGGDRDVKTFARTPFGTFVEHGSRASAAAHALADDQGIVGAYLKSVLGPSATQFDRINVAYKLLAAAGVEVD